jgi:hypothetical protein
VRDDRPGPGPDPQALGETLAALAGQIADLRGQVAQVNQRLDRAGLRGDLDIAARFEELARTVVGTLDAVAPRGPAAPTWISLDRDAYLAQLARVQHWADTVLRQHYCGYELRDCWPSHIHAVWEISTLAAAWHHAYSNPRPDLGRALEFHDRWLPGTMRRVTHITRACLTECVTRRNRPLVTDTRRRRTTAVVPGYLGVWLRSAVADQLDLEPALGAGRRTGRRERCRRASTEDSSVGIGCG